MKKKDFRRLLAAALCAGMLGTMMPAMSLVGAAETDESTAPTVPALPLKAREATEWTKLFDRRKGWIGSDGIFSFNLTGNDAIGSATEDDNTLFIFSDTLVGSVNETTLQVSSDPGPFMNHSAGVLHGNEPDPDQMQFIYGDHGDMTHTNIFGDGYWLMDGVALNNSVYVVGVTTGSDWRVTGAKLIKIPIVNGQPDMAHYQNINNLPIFNWKGEYSVVMGNGILDNTVEAGVPEDMADGYIYIYGYRQDGNYCSQLVVARVEPENFENGKAWRFWDGSDWVSNISKINKEEAVISPNAISNEMSVTPITTGPFAGKYMAVYCRSGQNRTMEYAIADSPAGPFSQGVAFYDAPEAEEYPLRTYSYNAKAHPHLSKEGKLLVTYNMNNPDMWSATNQIYRSRWVEIDLNEFADQPVLGDVSSHQPATASGFVNSESAPRGAVDGGYWQHSWRDDTKGDKWLQIDLGTVKYVSRYALRNAGWGDGGAKKMNTRDWTFQVSLDGETWTDVDEVSGNTEDKVIRDFEQAAARYVRLYITTPNQITDTTNNLINRATVTSLEVYGTPIPLKADTRTDVAQGRKVTVSGGQDTAAALVNGQWESSRDRWLDKTAGDKWAVVDLGGSYEISKYIVRHGGVREETRFNTNSFIIQASDDKETWRDIDRVDYNMHNITEREVEPFTARYVRLYIIKASLSKVDISRIYSFELYSDLAPNGGQWKLDEKEGTVAHDAIGGNDATVIGGAQWTDSPFGGALQFDGTSGMALAADYQKPTAAATYMAWVRADSYGKWATILKNWGENRYGQVHIGLTQDGRHLMADIAQADGQVRGVQEDAEFPLGEWVHVALTMDGSTITLYRGGEAVATGTYDGTLKTDFAPLGIGAKLNDAGDAPAGSNAGYWNGAIGDVRVYNRALSAAELKEILGRPIKVEEIENRSTTVGATVESLDLPATVQVSYSDGTTRAFDVAWDTSTLDLNTIGTYVIKGVYNETEVCEVTVIVRGNYATPDIAWWKLDETDGTTVKDAVGGADGVLQSGGEWASAKFGNGLNFPDSNGFVLVKNYQKPTATATYSAWVYVNDYTTYGTFIKNWGMDKNGQIHMGLSESGDRVQVDIVQSNGGKASVTDPDQFPLKQWTMVTAVADGENLVLYVNDKEVGRAAYDGTLKATGYNALGLGAKPNDAGNAVASSSQGYLNGSVDDVRVYSWDLTAADVANLYRNVRVEYRTELKIAIALAKAKMADARYSDVAADVKAALTAALADGEAVYADATVLQSDVDAAAAALNAIEVPYDVVLTADKTALKAAIADEVTDLSDYTAESVAAYQKALADARAVDADESALQDEIDAATAALIAAKEALTVKPAVGLLGDVNGDGKVDSGDALQLLRYAAEIITSDDLDLSVADLNGDGKVDSGDALLSLQYAAEIIHEFPAGA